MIEVKCPICNKKYKTYLSKGNKRITCSKECSKKLRSLKMSGNTRGFKKGQVSPMKNKKHSEKSKKKMSDNHKGQKPWNTGKNLPQWVKDKKSKSMKIAYINGKMNHMKEVWKETSTRWTGKGNPNWNNGSSFEEYGEEWTNKLKEDIRKRDNYVCQECSISQKKLKRKLCVHHIDYNKQNCNPNNLISLCLKCHLKTNFNRNKWEIHFLKNIDWELTLS